MIRDRGRPHFSAAFAISASDGAIAPVKSDSKIIAKLCFAHEWPQVGG